MFFFHVDFIKNLNVSCIARNGSVLTIILSGFRRSTIMKEKCAVDKTLKSDMLNQRIFFLLKEDAVRSK